MNKILFLENGYGEFDNVFFVCFRDLYRIVKFFFEEGYEVNIVDCC